MTFEELEKLVRDLECFIYPVKKGNRIQIYFDNGKLPKPLHILTYKEYDYYFVITTIKHRNIIPETRLKMLDKIVCDYWKTKED